MVLLDDYENRLTEFAIGGSGFSAEHTYDGFNRLIKTDATIGQNTQNFEHVYSHDLHIGSIEVTGTPVNGKVWRWGEGYGQEAVEAPQRYTASGVQFYNLGDESNKARKTYRVGAVTAGDYSDDSRHVKWLHVNGSIVPTRVALQASLSELFSAYNITLDADRAAYSERYYGLSLAATDLVYDGTRVKSPAVGRDLNPMGRGDGTYYANGGNRANGSVAVRALKPFQLDNARRGYGNSVNNQGIGGGGGDDPHAGCPTVEGDNRCWCIDCYECPGALTRWAKPAKDCCDAIKQSCVPGSYEDCLAPEVTCIYDEGQYNENCPIESKGGCPMPCKDPRFAQNCCDRQGNIKPEFQSIAAAFYDMCSKVADTAFCPSLRSGIRSCIARFCFAPDRTADCPDGSPALIYCHLKHPTDSDGLGWTAAGKCGIHMTPKAGAGHIFHEIIHTKWCKSARESVEKCAAGVIKDLHIRVPSDCRREKATYACQWLCFPGTWRMDHKCKDFVLLTRCCARGVGGK